MRATPSTTPDDAQQPLPIASRASAPRTELLAGRSQPARLGRRVRRRHPAADPVGLPRLRPAADPQLPRGAPGRAAGPRQDGSASGPISASPTITPEMNRRRLKQQNLVGPAGFVSMEDGCVGGFVQRGIAAAGDEVSVVEMGGDGRREPGDARDRSLGARLLEGLPPAHGLLERATGRWTRASSSSTPPTRAPSTTSSSRSGRTSSSTPASTRSRRPTTSRRACEAGLIYADSRGMLEDRDLRAARGQHLRAPALPPHRRPAGRPRRGRRCGRRRDAVPGRAHHARRQHGSVRHRLLSRQVRIDAAGALRFAERIVVCDGSRFDTLVAIPF